MSTKQKLAKKKRAQKAIQVAYLRDPQPGDFLCENYLLKMKTDTKILGDLSVIVENFNFRAGDCFFVQMSLKTNVVAGSDVRSLRNQRSSSTKYLLPIEQVDMQKIKACEEMIQFEKSDGASKVNPQLAHAPNCAVITEFSSGIDKYLASLQEQAGKITVITD